MTKDDIIKLAREATRVIEPGDPDYRQEIFDKEKFANLIAAHKAEVALAEAYRCGYEAGVVAEREACAKMAEETNGTAGANYLIANAIRARGTT